MLFQESVKPIVATSLLALYLPVPFYLVLLHALLPLWQRMRLWSYVFLLPPYILMVVLTIRLHWLWPYRAWHWPDTLGLLAVLPLGGAGWLAMTTYRTIEPGTLHLARQLDPSRGRTLITSGILSTVRHPRYLMFTLIAIGNVLITGYPLVALSLVVTIALLALTVWLEERELTAYFGDSYVEYKRKVPAFIPRLFGSRRAAS